MKHFLKKSALAAAALASLGSAQAAVITFEAGMDTSGAMFAPMLTNGALLLESGFRLETYANVSGADGTALVGALVNGADLANTCAGIVCPSGNSSTFFTSLDDGYAYLAEASDSNVGFYINGLSAAFIGNGVDPIPTTGASGFVRVQGVKADGTGSLLQDFVLGPAASNGVPSFASYTTTGAFATTAFKYAFVFGFYCSASGGCTNAFTNNKGQFALDDINVTAVPEPASWGLMGLGLVGIAAAARRRRNA